jgi:hypothetical protein
MGVISDPEGGSLKDSSLRARLADHGLDADV